MIEDDKKAPETEPSSEPEPEASDTPVEETPSSETNETAAVQDEENRKAAQDETDEAPAESEADGQTEAPTDDAEVDDDTEPTDDAETSDNADPAETAPREVLISRMESVVFASPEPMSVRKLANILAVDGKMVRELAAELSAFYQDRGIIMEEVSKGFQFRTHPKNAPVIRDVFKLKPLKLSKAALEALAIVAYRQPLTRAEAEQIRGVDCGGVLKYLFEKNLVRVIGRKEEPGRPIIYGTTSAFLELFGLKSLSDLPALHEFSELWEENQRIVDEEMPAPENEKRPPRPKLPGDSPPSEELISTGNPTSTESESDDKSGVENPSDIVENPLNIEDASDETNGTDEKTNMTDDPKIPTQNKPSSDPATATTEVIGEDEMAEILASIGAAHPADTVSEEEIPSDQQQRATSEQASPEDETDDDDETSR